MGKRAPVKARQSPSRISRGAGQLVAARDSATAALHCLLTDQLGSPELQVSASGAGEADALRTPYGSSRYGASQLYRYGFTGQRTDDATGLDYFVARYYDPVVGQFTSPDSVPDGLDRYAYVKGNPETRIDPSGHCWPECVIGAAVEDWRG